jgi:hypothetical protein
MFCFPLNPMAAHLPIYVKKSKRATVAISEIIEVVRLAYIKNGGVG